MPQYLAPGVYIEETSFRSKSIEGVGTSVAAMVGPAKFGPVRGTPEVMTNYAQFEKTFGSAHSLSFIDAPGTAQLNFSALAARAFFDNGGKQLYMTRVIGGGNSIDQSGAGSSAAKASAVQGDLAFNARFAGSGGNLDLEILWDDSQNLLRTIVNPSLQDNQMALLTIDAPVINTVFDAAGAHTGFPLKQLHVIVRFDQSEDAYVLAGTVADVINADDTVEQVVIATLGDQISTANLNTLDFKLTQLIASQPASGALAAGTNARLALTASIQPYFPDLDDATLLWGSIDASGTKFVVLLELNTNVVNVSFDLSELLLAAGAKSLVIKRGFSMNVIRRALTLSNGQGVAGVGEAIYQISGLSLDPSAINNASLGNVLTQHPSKKIDALSLPIACSTGGLATASAVYLAMFELFKANSAQLIPSSTSFASPRYIISLQGGDDGRALTDVDYIGEMDEINGNTGLITLEDIEDISIVMTPNAAANTATAHQSVVNAMLNHCLKMRYRIGLVDCRKDMTISEIRALRDNFDDSRLALYYPWVVTSNSDTSDPSGKSASLALPPCGFMAGIYARTDVERGVHKAPANTVVLGALSFNQTINKFQQELLNPNAINCLRSFPGRGHRVWGARTLSSDPEWKYVNVRRYFLYLERSIEKGTQWAVFEPNGEALWANVRITISNFLFNEWSSGHLLGASPEAAFFVRCDRNTMTQNDIDNGRLVCEVGVAPLRPAEFVIFRIGQKTADA
ncbi:MAG: phage tail sheath subtilisin-like domain-containing protein [Oceanospirillaceae bacterium]